jgi:hypothetical protein
MSVGSIVVKEGRHIFTNRTLRLPAILSLLGGLILALALIGQFHAPNAKAATSFRLSNQRPVLMVPLAEPTMVYPVVKTTRRHFLR